LTWFAYFQVDLGCFAGICQHFRNGLAISGHCIHSHAICMHLHAFAYICRQICRQFAYVCIHLHAFAYICMQCAYNCMHLLAYMCMQFAYYSHTICIHVHTFACKCIQVHACMQIKCMQIACKLYANVCKWMHMYAKCMHMYAHVCNCMQIVCNLYANVCQWTLLYANVCKCMPMYALCTNAHQMYANCLQSSGTRLSSFLIPSGRILGRASATGPRRNCLTAAMRERHMMTPPAPHAKFFGNLHRMHDFTAPHANFHTCMQFVYNLHSICMHLHTFAYVCIQFACNCGHLHTFAYNLHTICMQFACVCMCLHTFAYICIQFACICIRLHTFACMFAICKHLHTFACICIHLHVPLSRRSWVRNRAHLMRETVRIVPPAMKSLFLNFLNGIKTRTSLRNCKPLPGPTKTLIS